MTGLDNLPSNFVPKGWGYELWLVNKEEYCGKLLFFVKGKKCSYHYHRIKDETFYVHSGKIELMYSDDPDLDKGFVWQGRDKRERVILSKGDVFHIPVGRRHQMRALEDTELFEFSTQHFDTDSYRIVKGD